MLQIISLLLENKPGALAQVAAAVAECNSNIDSVEYRERDLRIPVQVALRIILELCAGAGQIGLAAAALTAFRPRALATGLVRIDCTASSFSRRKRPAG